MEISSQLARAAASCISQDFLSERSLADLAQTLGVTDRQMRRVFREEFGVSPVEYWQTQRLLLAKQLLMDSRLPVTSVALASGFQSLRRFNFALKERYRMTPTDLRKTAPKETPQNGSEFVFRLGYRPPFDWNLLVAFFSQRAIPLVETVREGAYLRTVQVTRQGKEYTGFLEVWNEPEKQVLAVRISDSLIPVCAIILERVRRVFDLQADPAAINPVLGSLAAPRPGLRVPGSFDGFEMSVRAILGQQVSVAGARTVAGRLAARFGAPIQVPVAPLGFIFPAPARMAQSRIEELVELGITRQKAQTLIALAKEISSGRLRLEPGGRVQGTLTQLRQIFGIGEWTAQYIAMRALAWPDAFPHTDLGIYKALQENNPKKVLALTEKWRPWRAYAALHLWTSLATQK
jgi:AraC family transcriptional regulator of adaptative response / DNA-3-methyladenine glycosylase II